MSAVLRTNPAAIGLMPVLAAVVLFYPLIRYTIPAATSVLLALILFGVMIQTAILRTKWTNQSHKSVSDRAGSGGLIFLGTPFYISSLFSFAIWDLQLLSYNLISSTFFLWNALLVQQKIHEKFGQTLFLISGVMLAVLCASAFTEYMPEQVNTSNIQFQYGIIENARLRTIFPHSNDFGVYAAALVTFFLSKSYQSGFVVRILKALMIAFAIILVARSQSESAYLVLATVFVWQFGNYHMHRMLRVGLSVVCVTLVFSQLFLAQYAMAQLQEGSVWWRFFIADLISEEATAIRFDPISLVSYPSWTHSLLLDVVTVYGLLPAIFMAIACGIVIVRLEIGRAVGTLLLLSIGLVQPVGAMPASLFTLSLACSYHFKRSTCHKNAKKVEGHAQNAKLKHGPV